MVFFILLLLLLLLRKNSTTLAASSENKVPFQQQEMSILKELVRSGSVTMTDSHADSLMMTGVHHTEEYSCLNGLTGEPTSLTSTDHLNHHHML